MIDAHNLATAEELPSTTERRTLLGTVGGRVLDVGRYAETGDVADLVRPPRRAAYACRSIGFEFDPEPRGPYVDEYVATFLPDAHRRAVVFQLLGAAVFGDAPPIERRYGLRGIPSAGRPTALSLLAAALGEYADLDLLDTRLPADVAHIQVPYLVRVLTDADRSHFLRLVIDGYADRTRRDLSFLVTDPPA